jgi:hypothetical protein
MVCLSSLSAVHDVNDFPCVFLLRMEKSASFEGPEAEFMNVNFVEVSGHNLESSQT